jgi:hypothetical protein
MNKITSDPAMASQNSEDLPSVKLRMGMRDISQSNFPSSNKQPAP